MCGRWSLTSSGFVLGPLKLTPCHGGEPEGAVMCNVCNHESPERVGGAVLPLLTCCSCRAQIPLDKCKPRLFKTIPLAIESSQSKRTTAATVNTPHRAPP
jgi:hypothetical protein